MECLNFIVFGLFDVNRRFLSSVCSDINDCFGILVFNFGSLGGG